MKKITTYLVVFLFLSGGITLLSMTVFAGNLGNFEVIKTKTFDKETFVFPSDVKGQKINLIFLCMSNDRDNGKVLQMQLLEWHKALAEQGIFSDDVTPYHFLAMNSPPFFVKGFIRSGMRDVYEGIVPLNQAGVLFLDDLESFAQSANLVVDEQATIVLASANGEPLEVFKGPVSEEGLQALVDALTHAVK